MSAILFCNAPKVDLLHYSYIFRKPEPLGVDMKNMYSYRLGTMLHLEIQKGEEAMKTSYFQKYIVGNAECMKRLTMATKGYGQLTSNDTYFDYIWCSGVKTDEEAMVERVDYFGLVKTIYKRFF